MTRQKTTRGPQKKKSGIKLKAIRLQTGGRTRTKKTRSPGGVREREREREGEGEGERHWH